MTDMALEKNGHKQPCYYCQDLCDIFAGNPSLWPIALCHSDDPGKVKWHHTGCVSRRLAALEIMKQRGWGVRRIDGVGPEWDGQWQAMESQGGVMAGVNSCVLGNSPDAAILAADKWARENIDNKEQS